MHMLAPPGLASPKPENQWLSTRRTHCTGLDARGGRYTIPPLSSAGREVRTTDGPGGRGQSSRSRRVGTDGSARRAGSIGSNVIRPPDT